MNEESVRETLRALADADAGAEARPEIELNLRQAFRARRRKRARREAMIWAAAVAGILAGNLFIHVMGIVIDFTETFPKAGGWWVGLVVHVVFIAAFGYLLFKGSKTAAATA